MQNFQITTGYNFGINVNDGYIPLAIEEIKEAEYLSNYVNFAPLLRILILPDGVTGNTSGFGPEESRFEPQSGN